MLIIFLDARRGIGDYGFMKKRYTHAEVVQKLRKLQGNKSMRTLAAELGVSHSTLSYFVSGQHIDSTVILQALGMKVGGYGDVWYEREPKRGGPRGLSGERKA